jgi:hypothetical protein
MSLRRRVLTALVGVFRRMEGRKGVFAAGWRRDVGEWRM